MTVRSSALLLTIALAVSLPVSAQVRCETVGGVLMTNINVIAGVTNLGPVFGDLQGSVGATILSQNPDGTFTVQHYWVTSSGDTILFKTAILKPTATDDANVVAVKWGNYISDIAGGTGKYQNATGSLQYFGTADFKELTLVLRYRGQVCYPQ